MFRWIWILFAAGLAGGLPQPVFGVETAAPAQAERPYGIKERTLWTTSRVTGFPQAPMPYNVERVFPKLKFNAPVDFCTAPGSDRLFVVELGGKIFSFPIQTNCEKADLFLDASKLDPVFDQAYGITFDPQYESNHFVYIAYVLKPGRPTGSHVSRFTVTQSNPPRADPASEQILITWPSGGHNGECIKFGPDGYLYISTGDGVGPDPPDRNHTGQDISDLLASMLRIDVKHPEGGKAYRVPPDNPFVNLPGARAEVWAYGLRNPFKMSFDKKTGNLWVGDVGYEKWELIHLVKSGGNYGWSIVEGRNTINGKDKPGPTPISPPIVDHPHSEASCIIGGQYYYGSRLPELNGAYIYGDYATTRIWGLRYDGQKVTWHQLLASSRMNNICFGEDNSGELYLLDYGGTINRLVANRDTGRNDRFPRKLSETGLFTSVKDLAPTPGVLPYSINAEPWADFARTERLAAIPGTSQINSERGNLGFPNDAVLVKTFSMEMERGNPASERRLETQMLHNDRGLWRAYTFRWNAEQTDADMVEDEGADETIEVKDAGAPGGRRAQTWHFPSRTECVRCHNPYAGTVLGFNARQLNRDQAFPGGTDNELRTLGHIQVFNRPFEVATTAKIANPYDAGAPVEGRARAYLQMNCAHCHRENSGGPVAAHMADDLKLADMRMIDALPTQGTFGIPEARVVAPGDPLRSVLYYRISKTGQGRMPYIGSSLVDVRGVNLLCDWIRQLPPAHPVMSAIAEEQTAVEQLRSPQLTKTTRDALIGRMLCSASGALCLVDAMNREPFADGVREEIVEKASRQGDAAVSDLFERFLPESRRIKRLSGVINAGEILALRGDPDQGKKIFTQPGGVQCSRCHRILGEGSTFGPDLSHIGQKYDRAQILDNIINPSKSIAPEFVTYEVETKDDLAYSGFILKRTGAEIILKDPTSKEITIPTAQVKGVKAQTLSAMPESLLQGMTAQGAADLIDYLSSLK